MSQHRLILRVLVGLCAITGCFGSISVGGVGTAQAASEPSCPNALARSEQGSAYLPDCRAYELVSPPNKKGGDVMADTGRVRVAVDGRAASFSSLTGFGDVRGMGIATDYISERDTNPNPGTNGWATHAITPPLQPMVLIAGSRGLDSTWSGDFSPDLSTGIFRAWSPVTNEDVNVASVVNLYRREDLRTAGAGHYQLVTPCPVCGSPLNPLLMLLRLGPPELVEASADFSHVLVQSNFALTEDTTTGQPNLYDWTGGELHPVGILPDNACGTPPCLAGGSTDNGVGGYGTHAISTDGSRITFTDASSGQIYQRINDNETVQVSASERTDCADHNPCNGTPEPDPNGTQPAIFALASTNGTRVFFTTTEQLTNDDNNPVTDLYMWDATRPTGQRLTRLSVDNEPADPPSDVIGVLGASDDGTEVYFAAQGQLVAGEPSGITPRIFAWHDGASPSLSYVGEMAASGADLLRDAFGQGSAGLRVSRVTPDGEHLLFMSHSGQGLLSAHGGVDIDQTHCSGGCAALYLYSAGSDTLACASCDSHGTPPTTDADTAVRQGTGAAASSAHLAHSLSDDGRWVFFNTSEALVPQDTNGQTDAYEYDSVTGKVYLLSSGEDGSPSYSLGASPDGSNAMIFTRQRLSGWDVDGAGDLYDVRVNGGFPEPPALPAGCQGDACQPAPLSLNDPTPASASFTGLGNPTVSVVPVVRAKSLTRAQRLAKAIRTCGRERGRKRIVCESRARKRYGGKSRAAGRSMSHKGGK
jgi:hypothetical protein